MVLIVEFEKMSWMSQYNIYLYDMICIIQTIDHSMFVKSIESLTTILLVYVDDLILTSNNIFEIQHVNTHLHNVSYIRSGSIMLFSGSSSSSISWWTHFESEKILFRSYLWSGSPWLQTSIYTLKSFNPIACWWRIIIVGPFFI